MSVDVSPRAQIKMGRGQWRMNVKRFDHPEFRDPIKKILKKGIQEISSLWVKDKGVFTPESPSAAQISLNLFDSMMGKVTTTAKKPQETIARAIGKIPYVNINEKLGSLRANEDVREP